MAGSETLAALETALTKDFRRFHVAAQAERLLGGSVSAFLLELTAGGTHNWSTKALIAAAVGAVWTTARQQWPTLPWTLVAGHLRAAKGAADAGRDAPNGTATNDRSA